MKLLKLHGRKRVVRLPALAAACLENIPRWFVDDGCSNSPDSWFGFDLRWACRIHDHFYCTLAHPYGSMTPAWKKSGDQLLRRCVRASLPWRWKWLAYVYYVGVKRLGGKAFDSCGDPPGSNAICRHGMSRYDQACVSALANRIDRATAEFEDRLAELKRRRGEADVEQEEGAAVASGATAGDSAQDS